MSRWRNNGGWNRRCGTVENTPRIDSYEAGAVGYDGALFAFRENGPPLVLDCYRDIVYAPDRDIETVELYHPKDGWIETLELSRKANGFGGSQVFFLCPGCGERRRYLYLAGNMFLCRKCAQLNYKSQQETRSDSMYFYHKGVALAEKYLESPPFPVDGFSFCAWIPERPKGTHQAVYRRYLQRFAKYQDQHQRRQLEDMARILRIFK